MKYRGAKITYLLSVCPSVIYSKWNRPKLHRLMRHVHHHLVHLECLRRGSSEVNQMAHKEFKYLYNGRNKHTDSIVVHLLSSWVLYPHSDPPVLTDRSTSATKPSETLSSIFKSSFSAAISLIHDISGVHTTQRNCI